MRNIITGQTLLILCCGTYLLWWFRGYRPGVSVSRLGGMNGALFCLTAALGIAGVLFSLMPVKGETLSPKLDPGHIIFIGILTCIGLFLITRFLFHRVVTTELFLIVGWTMLEIAVINRANATGFLSDSRFLFLCIVIGIAFVVSIVLYVAYYRMEEMKAFYAAMVPLVTESAAMAILIGAILC